MIWRWLAAAQARDNYLEWEERDEVRFSFVDYSVSVRALPFRDGSLLVLRQFGIPDTEEARMHIHANCRGGWVCCLTVLEGLLEHGIDLGDPTRETGASFPTYSPPAQIGLELQNSESV